MGRRPWLELPTPRPKSSHEVKGSQSGPRGREFRRAFLGAGAPSDEEPVPGLGSGTERPGGLSAPWGVDLGLPDPARPSWGTPSPRRAMLTICSLCFQCPWTLVTLTDHDAGPRAPCRRYVLLSTGLYARHGGHRVCDGHRRGVPAGMGGGHRCHRGFGGVSSGTLEGRRKEKEGLTCARLSSRLLSGRKIHSEEEALVVRPPEAWHGTRGPAHGREVTATRPGGGSSHVLAPSRQGLRTSREPPWAPCRAPAALVLIWVQVHLLPDQGSRGASWGGRGSATEQGARDSTDSLVLGPGAQDQGVGGTVLHLHL